MLNTLKREPASRTTVSTERSSLNPARQLHSSESSVLSVDSCKPSETIRLAEPEQLLMPDSHVKSEPQAHATPIAKLSQQIRSFKKRRRKELDILFTTRGSSDAESRVPSAYQIEAENYDRAKRIKREEGSRSSPLVEGVKTSDRVNKQKSLEYRPGNEQEHLADVSRKHGPSRWRQRTGHPLFCTPDPEKHLKDSGQHESPRASVDYPRRNAQCLSRQRSEHNRTPAASVITRAQYKDLLARSSQDPINRDKGPFDSSRSLTSSQRSRRRRSSQNKTRPRRDFSDKNLSGGTSTDYPRSWDEATVADRQLVEMRDKGVFWNIVRDTWQDITERRIAPENLKIRHSYLVSLRNDQSNIPGSAARIDDKTVENAAKSQGCPSKFSRPDHNEQIDSSEDDDDFLDAGSGQSSESGESSDLNDQYGEDSEPDGPARAVRGQLSRDGIEQRNSPSASTTVKHVPASERNNRALPVPNQETSTNSACGSPSWKLASRQAKSQNPLEKCYKRSKTVFKGPDLTTANAEPGAAVKALELAASIFKNVPINTDAPKPPEERPVAAWNEIQSIREEPLDEQNARYPSSHLTSHPANATPGNLTPRRRSRSRPQTSPPKTHCHSRNNEIQRRRPIQPRRDRTRAPSLAPESEKGAPPLLLRHHKNRNPTKSDSRTSARNREPGNRLRGSNRPSRLLA